MNLRKLIETLENLPPEKVFMCGFSRPHSWRGVYAELAFEPESEVSVAGMLADAKSAVGKSFEGYKGGEFIMDLETEVHLAEYGTCGEDGSLENLFTTEWQDRALKAEKGAEALRGRVKELERDVEHWRKMDGDENRKREEVEVEGGQLLARAEAAEKALAEAKAARYDAESTSALVWRNRAVKAEAKLAEKCLCDNPDGCCPSCDKAVSRDKRLAAAESAVRDRDTRIEAMREVMMKSVIACCGDVPNGDACGRCQRYIDAIAKTPSPSAQEPEKCEMCGGTGWALELETNSGYDCPNKCRPSAQEKP